LRIEFNIKGLEKSDLSDLDGAIFDCVISKPILCCFPLVENSEGKFEGGTIVEQYLVI